MSRARVPNLSITLLFSCVLARPSGRASYEYGILSGPLPHFGQTLPSSPLVAARAIGNNKLPFFALRNLLSTCRCAPRRASMLAALY